MSGSQPTNNQAVQFEQQQAADAAAKDALRQQRLTQGQAAINALFDPQPVMASQTQNFDWSSFNPVSAGRDPTTGATNYSGANLPAGYSVVNEPAKTSVSPTSRAAGLSPTAAGYGTSSANTYNTGRYAGGMPAGSAGSAAASATPAMTMAVQGPDGKIYYKGDPLSYTSQVPTGQTTGGFGPDFYNNYKQQYLNYYLPDEARQYQVAQRNLNYNLARAGTLESSTAADKAGDLAYGDANAQAVIQANANQAVGDLQSQVQSQKQSLINQLYSTEDPTLTANLAQSSANALNLKTPTLTPAAALFDPALTAAGSAAASYLSPYSPYTPNMYATGTNVAPASASSGKAYS